MTTAAPQHMELRVRIRFTPFLMRVGVATVFFVGFSFAFFYGLNVRDDVFDDIGSSTKSEHIVTRYNAISGFVMELFQVAVWIGMNQFMPVYATFWHNVFHKAPPPRSARELQHAASTHDEGATLPRRGSARSKWSRFWRGSAIWWGPMILVVMIENSSKSFQASQKTVGYLHVMTWDDLFLNDTTGFSTANTKKLTVSDVANASSASNRNDSVRDTVLLNAIMMRSVPFELASTSPCFQTRSSAALDQTPPAVTVSMNALESSSVVYGFRSNPWNDEAIPYELKPNMSQRLTVEQFNDSSFLRVPLDGFDPQLHYDMFLHGLALFEKQMLDSVGGLKFECALANISSFVQFHSLKTLTKDECWGTFSFVERFGDLYDGDLDMHTLTERIFNITSLFGSPLIEYERYQINSQLWVDAIRIDIEENPSTYRGYEVCGDDRDDKCKPDYSYNAENTNSLCGSKECVLISEDRSNKYVSMVPFMRKANPQQATINSSTGSFTIPHEGYLNDSALVFGMGAYRSADAIISKAASGASEGSEFTVVNLRSHQRVSMARIHWQLEDLDTRFEAECVDGPGKCKGLAHRLQRTGRFLMLGEQALPIERLHAASLDYPIPLVQLNTPVLRWVSNAKMYQYEVQRLDKQYIKDLSKWKNLQGAACSPLIDMYVAQVDKNNYKLDKPLQVMYTAAFFFLFDHAAVTEVNATAGNVKVDLAVDRGREALTGLKLNGDVQERNVRLLMPLENQLAAAAACGLLIIMISVVASSSSDVLREWEHVSPADEFVAMQDDDAYADRVHHKSFHFPTAGQHPMEDFELLELSLVAKKADQDPARLEL